jgi:hypothetical protein
VPAQQVERIAPAGQRAGISQHEIPQVGADRLDYLTVTVHHDERKIPSSPSDHGPDGRNRAMPLQQGTTHILDHTNSLIAISVI